jgi:hypothetical protein
MMVDCRPQASLPNPLGRFFFAKWHFVTKLGPQVSSFPLPIFGDNRVFSSGISDELQTLIRVLAPHQPLHPHEAQCLWMIGLAEVPLKARPEVAILACLTKITQCHVQ